MSRMRMCCPCGLHLTSEGGPTMKLDINNLLKLGMTMVAIKNYGSKLILPDDKVEPYYSEDEDWSKWSD